MGSTSARSIAVCVVMLFIAGCASGALVTDGTTASDATAPAAEATVAADRSIAATPITLDASASDDSVAVSTTVAADTTVAPPATSTTTPAPETSAAANSAVDTTSAVSLAGGSIAPGDSEYCVAAAAMVALGDKFDELDGAEPADPETGYAALYIQLFEMVPSIADRLADMAAVAPAAIKVDLDRLDAALQPVRDVRPELDALVADMKAADGDIVELERLATESGLEAKLESLDALGGEEFEDTNVRVDEWTSTHCGGIELEFSGTG